LAKESSGGQTYHTRSVSRALEILACFSQKRPELSLNEICELAGLPKPTVFRLLSALESARFVERCPGKDKYYQVGIKAFEVGCVFLSHLSVERVARPIMDSLSKQFHLSVNLGILDQGQVVYLAVSEPDTVFRYTPIIGYRHYVHCSALGKVLVTPLPEEELDDILAAVGMPALTPHTITNPRIFKEHLALVRQQGYATDIQEGGLGFCCLAVPIHNHEGEVVAAMSISGSNVHFDHDGIHKFAAAMKEAAAQVSAGLGYGNTPEANGA
jgi:IclR family KDG regulon transcriptional repressor